MPKKDKEKEEEVAKIIKERINQFSGSSLSIIRIAFHEELLYHLSQKVLTQLQSSHLQINHQTMDDLLLGIDLNPHF